MSILTGSVRFELFSKRVSKNIRNNLIMACSRVQAALSFVREFNDEWCILHNLFFYSLGKWPTFSRREDKLKTTKEFIDVLKGSTKIWWNQKAQKSSVLGIQGIGH